MATFIILIIYLPLAIFVANEGKKKNLEFGLTLIISLLFSPLIGYLYISNSTARKSKMPPHKVKRLLGQNAEEGQDHERAMKFYKESLYHLENDYKYLNLPKHSEEKRLIYLNEIQLKIEHLADKIMQK